MSFRYSKRAEQDLADIAEYSSKRWSDEQAVRYLIDLDCFCAFLAANPRIGHAYSERHPTWLLMVHVSHVIYYRTSGRQLIVQRILHKSRLASLHLPI